MAFDAYMIDFTDEFMSIIGAFSGAGVNQAAWTKAGDLILHEETYYRFTGSGVWQGAWTPSGGALLFDPINDGGLGLFSNDFPYMRPPTFAGYMYEIHVTALPEHTGDTMREIILGLIAYLSYNIVTYTVQFYDQSTDGPIEWYWDFGDGIGSSTEQNPPYMYTAVGWYLVTLTVTWPGGYTGVAQDWVYVFIVKKTNRINIIGVV